MLPAPRAVMLRGVRIIGTARVSSRRLGAHRIYMEILSSASLAATRLASSYNYCKLRVSEVCEVALTSLRPQWFLAEVGQRRALRFIDAESISDRAIGRSCEQEIKSMDDIQNTKR